MIVNIFILKTKKSISQNIKGGILHTLSTNESVYDWNGNSKVQLVHVYANNLNNTKIVISYHAGCSEHIPYNKKTASKCTTISDLKRKLN